MLARLALLGVALRLAVPAGYMPADLSDGWYLEWCPDGLPVAVTAALLGHGHHHHDDGDDGRCELGGGLSTTAVLEPPVASELVPALAEPAVWQIPLRPSPAATKAYDSRAPPRAFSFG